MRSFFDTKKGAAVLIGCLFVFLAFAFLGRRTDRPSARSAASIGAISSLIGEAEGRRPGTVTFEKLTEGESIAEGEVVVAHEASQVTLSFGAASVRLQPGARLVAQKDTARSSGAVLATLLEGDADVLTTAPDFRLMKDGRDITATGSSAETRALVVKGGARVFAAPRSAGGATSAAGATSAGGRGAVITATTPVETPADARPTPSGSGAGDDSGEPAAKDSLSNEEIRRALAAESGFYRRCYLTYLNRVSRPPSSKASTVTVGFVISNSGKVHDAKIVRSDFDDAVLNNCILETVERTPFRAFKANDIPVLEFPIELR